MKRSNIITLFAILLTLFACRNEVNNNLLTEVDSVESTFTDTRDGQSYKCVKIGKQTWMAENLKFRLPLGGYDGCSSYNEKDIDTTTIKVDKIAFKDSVRNAINRGEIDVNYGLIFSEKFLDKKNEKYYGLSLTEFLEEYFPGQEPPMTFYEFFQEILPILYRINSYLQNKVIVQLSKKYTNYNYVKEYGYLYSYEAALQAVPKGWRLPTDDDWKELEKTLGIVEESELDKMEDWRGTMQGEALRKSDRLKFYAKMAGGKTYALNHFINKGVKAYYWTSTESHLVDSMKTSVIRALQFENPKIYRGVSIQKPKQRNIYYSVRCIKK